MNEIMWTLGTVAISVALVCIGYLLGRFSAKPIGQHKPEPLPAVKRSKQSPEPEGDLFNDAMRGKPTEERRRTA